MDENYFDNRKQEILKIFRLLYFPDNEILDLHSIAKCIKKSHRTIYRLFENGELQMIPGQQYLSTSAGSLKEWVIKKYCKDLPHNIEKINCPKKKNIAEIIFIRDAKLKQEIKEYKMKIFFSIN